jgi:NAD(P)-dependent dehydrogenase (short-subunit alcohol dehydrogenase family)
MGLIPTVGGGTMAALRGLEGRVVIVAGAAAGIGAATALRLAEAGAKVVIGDFNLAAAEELSDRITDEGGTAIPVQYDQGDESSVANLVSESIGHFGSLHGVHANAAETRFVGRDVDVGDMEVEVWERTILVNLIGYAIVIRSALPYLVAGSGGSIVCTSSMAAAHGYESVPAYSVSKAGVNALCRHVATRWGWQGIRCNAVAPGVILSEAAKTHMSEDRIEEMLAGTRSTRLGTSDDIAAAAHFSCRMTPHG